MPTARELLEQAEALMRRDRMAALASEDDFPVLTDAVPEAIADAPAEPVDVAATVAASVDTAAAPPPVTPLPALPEPAVARLVAEQADVAPDEQGEPSIWAVPPGAITITETGPDSLSPATHDEVPAPARETEMAADADALWRSDVSGEGPEIVEATTAETEVSTDAALVDRGEEIVAPIEDFPLDATLDATRWNLMAEDIRMQVLQRIDIFTDAGLREQLTARLQPIVDRASADLVGAINQHVGQILRQYVAEAIEREIEKWRQEPR